MNFSLTTVSREVVWCQGKLLVEFTDGSVAEYTHWGRPPEHVMRWSDPCGGYLHLTHAQLVECCRSANTTNAAEVRANLHLSKERRYGHGYQHRGY